MRIYSLTVFSIFLHGLSCVKFTTATQTLYLTNMLLGRLLLRLAKFSINEVFSSMFHIEVLVALNNN